MTALHQNAGIGVDQRRPFREHLRRFNLSADDRLALKRALATLYRLGPNIEQAGEAAHPAANVAGALGHTREAVQALVSGLDGEFGS